MHSLSIALILWGAGANSHIGREAGLIPVWDYRENSHKDPGETMQPPHRETPAKPGELLVHTDLTTHAVRS